MTPIACQSCGYANETTRVFCHQCGVRLERPANEEQEAATQKAKKPVPIPKRKPESEAEAKPFSLLTTLIRSAVFAAMFAAILLMLRPPKDIPTPAVPNAPRTQALEQRFALAITPGPFPRQLVLTEDDVRTLLATQVTVKDSGKFNLGFLSPGENRPYITLLQNGFLLGLEIPIAGQKFVIQTEFQVNNLEPGNLSVVAQGGKIGSLKIPPLVAEKVLRWYEALGKAYAVQLGEIQKATQVLITPEHVEIIWPANK